MADPLQTAARVLEAMSLYANYHGTSTGAYQERKNPQCTGQKRSRVPAGDLQRRWAPSFRKTQAGAGL